MRIDFRAAALAALLAATLAGLAMWLATPAEPRPCEDPYGECHGTVGLPDLDPDNAG